MLHKEEIIIIIVIQFGGILNIEQSLNQTNLAF